MKRVIHYSRWAGNGSREFNLHQLQTGPAHCAPYAFAAKTPLKSRVRLDTLETCFPMVRCLVAFRRPTNSRIRNPQLPLGPISLYKITTIFLYRVKHTENQCFAMLRSESKIGVTLTCMDRNRAQPYLWHGFIDCANSTIDHNMPR